MKAVLVSFAIKCCIRDAFYVNFCSHIVSSPMYYATMKQPSPIHHVTISYTQQYPSMRVQDLITSTYYIRTLSLCTGDTVRVSLTEDPEFELVPCATLIRWGAGSLTFTVHNIVTKHASTHAHQHSTSSSRFDLEICFCGVICVLNPNIDPVIE